MLNDFLTHTLQVIIILDVVGVIAWFVLAARRDRSTSAELPAPSMAVDESLVETSAWQRLTGRPARAAAAPQTGMDDALGQLRQVLDSYRSSLA